MDRPRRWLWERPFLQEESEPSGLDRLFGTGSAVLERFEEQQVQVLGHQIDVGFEQAQHLAAMPQLVDSIDPASAEIQPGQTLFFFEPGLPRRVRQVPMILSRRLRLPFGRTGPFRYRQTGCGNCRLMVPPCHTSAMRFRPCLNS